MNLIVIHINDTQFCVVVISFAKIEVEYFVLKITVYLNSLESDSHESLAKLWHEESRLNERAIHELLPAVLEGKGELCNITSPLLDQMLLKILP